MHWYIWRESREIRVKKGQEKGKYHAPDVGVGEIPDAEYPPEIGSHVVGDRQYHGVKFREPFGTDDVKEVPDHPAHEQVCDRRHRDPIRF